ncbi:hypothetical protein FB567DRAFT_550551 [Paraphoma chrysanthemicola]|uniref:Uncharacterized protein n=1 Tax=Paraphoma chrysanthemicola TaxID=798071 RepID=A0A8K0R5T6_9PLEO|nr:hypothetical protein FB567DRAFT_550551 [Paraphoma chrysanthemicola]
MDDINLVLLLAGLFLAIPLWALNDSSPSPNSRADQFFLKSFRVYFAAKCSCPYLLLILAPTCCPTAQGTRFSQINFPMMGIRTLKVQDWIRRQKVKYLFHTGGPPTPDRDTKLYFDWRRLRMKPRQDHQNIHPGTQSWE